MAASPRWITWTVLALGVLAFAPTLGGGFLGDDFIYIARFREFPWAHWPRLFTQDWSGGVWGMPLRELRPFAALSFLGDARLFGGDALGYRLTNLTFHLFSTAIVVRLAWRYSLGSRAAALVAGLVFAAHPAHAEAVSWITGRVDVQATAAALLFWLGAEVFVEKGRGCHLGCALAAFFIGIFSKELCLFAPLLLLLRWVLLDPRVSRETWQRRALVLGGALAILAIYGWCRRAAFAHDALGYNLWRDVPAWQRQAGYAGWLVPVLPFNARTEWQSFPPLATLHGIWIAIAATTIGALAFARGRGYLVAASAIFFGGVWYLVSVFPLTGVTYFTPRHLYFPTVGLALGVGLACTGSRWRSALGALFIVACALAHVAAVKPWRAAGVVSRESIAMLDRALASAPAGTIALTAVPETLGPVWLWSWASPACVRPPFVAHPPTLVVERQGNYARVDHWFTERKPLESIPAAPAAVALYVSPTGEQSCRLVPREELQRRLPDLARVGPTGISVEYWTDWVKSLARPEPVERATP